MAVDGTVKILVDYDTTEAESSISKLSDSGKKLDKSNKEMSTSLLKVGAVAGGVFAGLSAFMYSTADSASNLNEAINVVSSTFGDGTDEIISKSKEATKQMGASEIQYLNTVGVFGAMGKGMKLDATEMQKYATDLTQLSGDLASFKNINQDVAATALKGVYTGETEALKSLGIMIDVNTLKQYGYNENMTQAEKVAVRYNAVMDQTIDMQGDFAKTGDGFANKQRTMKANFENLTMVIGTNFIPMFEKAFGVIDTLIIKFTEWIEKNPELVATLMPITIGVGILAVVLIGLGIAFGIAALAGSGLGVVFGIIFSPITLIILAIAGLIAIVIALYTKFEWFRELINPLIEQIKTTFQLLYEKISEVFNNIMSKINEFYLNNKALIDGLIYIFSTLLVGAISLAFERISGIITNLANTFMSVFGGIMRILQGIIDFVVGVFTGDWEKAWGGLTNIFGGIWDIIKGIFKGGLNFVIGLINGVLGGINLMTGLINKIPGINIPQIPKIPSLAIGTNRVMSDGIAEIHKGEAIVPADVVSGGFKAPNTNGGIGNYTINIDASNSVNPKGFEKNIINNIDVFFAEKGLV